MNELVRNLIGEMFAFGSKANLGSFGEFAFDLDKITFFLMSYPYL